jgi:Ran GTPase-activating protein (RanGAP) involved in mRNA processing and transport
MQNETISEQQENLHRLNYGFKAIKPEDFDVIINFLSQHNNLHKWVNLSFADADMDDQLAPFISKLLISCPQGTVINLGSNQISAKGAEKIAATLKSCKDNLKIHLTGNNLGDDGAIFIAKALEDDKCPHNLELYLSYCNIGVKGVEAILTSLKKYSPPGLKIDLDNNDSYSEQVVRSKTKILHPGVTPGSEIIIPNGTQNRINKLLKHWELQHLFLACIAFFQGTRDSKHQISFLPLDLIKQIFSLCFSRQDKNKVNEIFSIFAKQKPRQLKDSDSEQQLSPKPSL